MLYTIKEILIRSPDLALLSNLIGSNYPCFKLIFMVPKVFEPLKIKSLVMSMMVSFCAVLFPHMVSLDEILNLIESVSEGFPSYSFILIFYLFRSGYVLLL